MSVDSVWEPTVDIFSHHIFIWRAEPGFFFHSDCRDWKHTFSFSYDIVFFPPVIWICLFISHWRCSLLVRPVLKASSRLKVMDSQPGRSHTSCIPRPLLPNSQLCI